MNFKIIEESKEKLIFELEGETHTFCNALKRELQGTKGVTVVAYKIDHPLVGVPRFQLETKGVDPKKAIKDALKSLKKKVANFEKEVKGL